MKQLILSLIAVSFAAVAHADNLTGPAWVCSLEANASGVSVGLFFNVTDVKGEGEIKCSRPEDKMNVTVPVAIQLGGLGFGLGFSKIKELKVYTLNVGVADPSDMLGEFNAGLEAAVTVVEAGAGVMVGVQADSGLAFDLGVVGQKAKGLNIKVGGFVLEIDQIGEAVYTPWVEAAQ
ncbi:MAG: hypothetical protein IT287_00250 [Bdellovibrionaceae bacterium]|nr:hypothetical protein [Pseudobdellovibrionaceae bacterium]